jgi:hypothetical protein
MIIIINGRAGGIQVDQSNMSTGEFVQKVKDTQQKAQKNQEHNGNGTPSEKLPTKQHTNNP